MATEEREGSSSSVGSSHGVDHEKMATDRIEQIHTNERVPGHTNYYEKDGLRTYGDDEGEQAIYTPSVTIPS